MSKLYINTDVRKSKINKNIYGHFSEHLGRCIYQGIYVGETSDIPNVNGMRRDVVDALRHIQVPVLRWPGGCFADEYHWRDGVGPKNTRKRMVNTHWGGVVEDNSFGTHEFMELCAQIGCEPYINGNVGSGSVREMNEWVEYLTFDGVSPMAELRTQNGRENAWTVKYFGIGNENWGCGGNMRPEYYADLYRQFQTYVRNYGENKIYKIACGANSADYDWTDKVMGIAGRFMDAITLHHYTVPGGWKDRGSATEFSAEKYYQTIGEALRIEEILSNHLQIMNRHDPEHKVSLIIDEWGTWFNVEQGTNPGFLYQQNTMRDALVAAATLNIFNKHSDRISMANIAQTVNVLQAVILTEGGRMVLTPTYHVFDLYKAHQNATLIDSFVETVSVGEGDSHVPNLSVSASVDDDGALHVTLANLSLTESFSVDGCIQGMHPKAAEAKVLTGQVHAHNTFEQPETVKPADFAELTLEQNRLAFTIPANSVMSLTLR